MAADDGLWMDQATVLGRMERQEAAQKLREVGEVDEAMALDLPPVGAPSDRYAWTTRRERAWKHTAHAIGFIAPPKVDSGGALAIDEVGSVTADPSLANARVTVSLDQLRVVDYPGGGTHNVLLHFFAKHQAGEQIEEIQFSQAFRVREGESAGVTNHPIYVGLQVPPSGLAFRCLTVNIRNEEDQIIVDVLSSSAVQAGLKLLATVQPAIGLLSKMAEGFTRALASRNKNVPVQQVHLGLDFSALATGARLAEGSYLVVQVPDRDRLVWDWGDWEFSRATGRVARRGSPTELIPYNSLIFGIRRS